jgi:hypothetical protein
MAYRGITAELIGDSGSGKTTQAGEYAKYVYKTRKKKTVLHTCDRGGYDSISALERKGILIPDIYTPDQDPWIWINRAVSGFPNDPDIGADVFDSGTSMGDLLLAACRNSDFQVGQQKTQKFTVARGSANLTVNLNNEAHFGVVQGFMLENIRKSTWLIEQGRDVIWTFVLLRDEAQDRTPILGPKVAGKALTPFLPKEFRYTFRLDSQPQQDAPPIHRLYLSEHPELAGLGHSFGNARYPLGVTPLPPYIEPASLPEAMEMIARGQEEADQLLANELGL